MQELRNFKESEKLKVSLLARRRAKIARAENKRGQRPSDINNASAGWGQPTPPLLK